ncbi:MAG TPA: pteridine reductase [Gammaproteobacteria bacterium]|nr:pteridine reductase [Gammaproteobacteria bacterium]
MKAETKVVLITGAARRIGAAVAEACHEAGYNLVLHYRQAITEAEQLCSVFNQKRPHSALIARAELQEGRALKQLLERAEAEWGRLDVLVNNASCFNKTPFGQIKEEDWTVLMDTNLKAPFFLAQLAAPYLAKTAGCIINLTDIHVDKPFGDYSVYCLTKAGLVALTRILAKELAPRIRVNAISPGMIIWPEGENQLAEALKQKIINEAALKRIGSPEDIAKAVLFFVRDADYITGQILAVDGGRLL